MDEQFHLALTDEDKRYLGQLVRWSIRRRLDGEPDPVDEEIPEPAGAIPHQTLGAFVTLRLEGQLRGCIGLVVGQEALYIAVCRMALAAAFEDPRFPPVSVDEERHLEIEISVMGPVEPCPDPQAIIPGRHGLIVRQGMRSGLLLPQVAVEWGWDAPTFLEHTCRKAGLNPGCWKEPSTRLYWFEAEVFTPPE